MRSITLAAAAILVAATLPHADAADLKTKPLLKAPPPAPVSGGFWIGADYLNWSMKGDRLPPLVTTAPIGTSQAQAGVLGAPGTSILFGNGSVADGSRSGVRLRGGYWFDPQHTQGIEAQAFILDRNATDFSLASNGNPILAEPFFDPVAGRANSILAAFPGQASGAIAINETTRLFGAGADYRRELCKSCAFGSVDLLVGYRYLRLRDDLTINTAVSAAGFPFVPGTLISAVDQFGTTNNFHGLDLGLTGDMASGAWRLTWLAKVAVGGTFTSGSINGSTTIAVPGAATTSMAGGIYAEPTNIGGTSSSHLAVAPELGLTAGYQVTSSLRATAGYSLLYWTGLVRPGGTIDTAINTSQQNGGALVGPARPSPQANTTDFWAQGFNLGLVYNY